MFLKIAFFGSFAASLVALDPGNCPSGQTVVENFVKLDCDNTISNVGNFQPLGCVAPNGDELQIGQTTNDDHFRYICVQSGETVRFYANACLRPDHSVLNIGEIYVPEDGKIYQCVQSNDGGVRLDFVQPGQTQISNGCIHNGSNIAAEKTVQVDRATFVCAKKGERYEWEWQSGGRCVMKDGYILSPNQEKSEGNVTYKCLPRGLKIMPVATDCFVNGIPIKPGYQRIGESLFVCNDAGVKNIGAGTCGIHQFDEIWYDKNLFKRCEYRKGQVTDVDIYCMHEGRQISAGEVVITNATEKTGKICRRSKKDGTLAIQDGTTAEVSAWLSQ